MGNFSLQRRRQLLSTAAASLGLAALGAAGQVLAQAVPAVKPGVKKAVEAGSANTWRLVINEAVTGETNNFLLMNRYKSMGDFLASQLKGKAVTVEPIVDIKRFMSVAQGAAKPELVFGKSVNQLAKLVRNSGYQPIVKRADPYKAAFIVAKDSPIKTLADVASHKIIMPDAWAATSAVALAELRLQKIPTSLVTHVKFQDEVAQYLKSGLGQVGVVNPTIAKKWVEEGGRVLAETQPVVNWSLLAAPGVPPEVVAQLRDALMSNSAEATAVMASIGVKAWAKAETSDYAQLLAYTKE